MQVASTLDDIDVALQMADKAREIALRYFRMDIGLSMKSDRTPVTLADREIERVLRDMLAETRSGDGVFGEEWPASGPEMPRQWVIDPIDGTGAFATGSPLFGALIGLMDKGTPILGIIDACALQERWVAWRGKATFNGTPCHTSGQQSLRGASIGSTAVHQYADSDYAAFQRVSSRASITRLGGDSYAYGLVASGHLDAVIETGLKPYDYLPILPIIEAAGGIMTDWAGQPLGFSSQGHVVAAATPELHAELIAQIKLH
jgi:inositol-phosphate phosphatase / L-galactose 1-phosphate phosphatase / histidinol-phosphatase